MSPPFPFFGLKVYSAFWGLVSLSQDLLPTGNFLLTVLLFAAYAAAQISPADLQR